MAGARGRVGRSELQLSRNYRHRVCTKLILAFALLSLHACASLQFVTKRRSLVQSCVCITQNLAFYFTYLARTSDFREFLVTCSSRGRNQCAKFYRNRLWGLDSAMGRISAISIGLRRRR